MASRQELYILWTSEGLSATVTPFRHRGDAADDRGVCWGSSNSQIKLFNSVRERGRVHGAGLEGGKEGTLGAPFVLVVSSIPNENVKHGGFWTGMA
jgi:hypothetical protein